MSEFEEYLESKKIDSGLFKNSEPERWEEFNKLFSLVNPKSFTMQKLFLLNQIRRKYHLEPKEETAPKPVKKKFKPVIRKKG
ncbi:hypothetical protein [Chondrinema litorale]|uniref:hypothetical protein n=1 Tax=Chondrinema litorale TaxID=2994555 RepID=UPI002542BE3B|nr:hypothetical protein [Chondrinema litorale]UZR92371.1 hypothetical protein OQ292_10915 [Chondrinema litorale]